VTARRPIVTVALLVVTLSCTSPPKAVPSATVVVGSCPPDTLPPSRRSVLSLLPGSPDSSFGHGLGGLFVELKGDESNPRVRQARIFARGAGVARDTFLTDTTLFLKLLPPGRYSVGSRSLGYLSVTESVSVRAGYLDTLRLSLATSVVCVL
jgi:hypothetical protein